VADVVTRLTVTPSARPLSSATMAASG